MFQYHYQDLFALDSEARKYPNLGGGFPPLLGAPVLDLLHSWYFQTPGVWGHLSLTGARARARLFALKLADGSLIWFFLSVSSEGTTGELLAEYEVCSAFANFLDEWEVVGSPEPDAPPGGSVTTAETTPAGDLVESLYVRGNVLITGKRWSALCIPFVWWPWLTVTFVVSRLGGLIVGDIVVGAQSFKNIGSPNGTRRRRFRHSQ
ncbi:hypothetical protein EDD18DRAFT_1099045 [Armillaria luteobubalina]|uniref:Uncharacterized protein n=1 Tax=Armillaria luteobubalina TaxID=153913 RepID=A0AA39QIS8_9AGAR|nr:hypothetical protein EDD18DRAFT_1099045 [Armillaria luteobubalina]